MSGNVLVCASGPSLELQIETIKELSKNHLVVCAASSSGVLLKHGIRVDYIALVEREEAVADDYSELVCKYPHAKDIRIIMLVHALVVLLIYLTPVAVYFRAVLSPLALYSESPQQILVGEGPQSINAAFSFALSLRPERVCLAGCDLGATDSIAQRSVNALGHCERVWNQQVKGNLADKIYTNALMLDSRDVMEQLMGANPDKVFNISNGIYIDNASPIPYHQYLEESRCFSTKAQDILITRTNNWWVNLPSSNSTKMAEIWRSKKPYQNVYDWCNQVRELIQSSDKPWMPDMVDEISNLCNLDVSLARQLPRRIMRSTLIKLSLAITQQRFIFNKHGSAW